MTRLVAWCCALLLAGCAGTHRPVVSATAAPATIEIVPVSFRLWELVTINHDGGVHLGIGLFGNLTSDGRLTRSDGTLIATLDADGMVRIAGAADPTFHITHDGVPQALPIVNGEEGPPAYYMDDASLVVGANNSSTPVAGYRQDAAAETLFVASVIVGTREDAWQ
jgi:hypothetical protein